MTKLFPLAGVAFLATSCFAGPSEDANLVVQRWSSTYSANDNEALVKHYWPDAILLGTVSPVMSEGKDAIQTYFAALKGSGNKNELGETKTIVLNQNAVVVTGFYVFTRIVEGKPVPAPMEHCPSPLFSTRPS